MFAICFLTDGDGQLFIQPVHQLDVAVNAACVYMC